MVNHRFYFNQLKNPSKGEPSGSLMRAIIREFGSMDRLKGELKASALSVFGSGYAWLVVDGKKLKIVTTANQDVPLQYNMLLNIDVWEHAYYLKHYNVRADYIDDLFHIIDWDKVGERYDSIKR